jgi:hypothetical protein
VCSIFVPVDDFSLRGLDQLLSALPTLGLESATRKAALLWEALCDLEDRRGSGAFLGTPDRRCNLMPLRACAFPKGLPSQRRSPESPIADNAQQELFDGVSDVHAGSDGGARVYLKKVELLDLMNGGFITAGMSLFPRRKKYSHQVAALLPDGKLEVGGVSYVSPSDAATAITGKRTNGWWFFLTDQNTRVSLRNVRRDYIDALAVEAEDDEADQEEDED